MTSFNRQRFELFGFSIETKTPAIAAAFKMRMVGPMREIDEWAAAEVLRATDQFVHGGANQINQTWPEEIHLRITFKTLSSLRLKQFPYKTSIGKPTFRLVSRRAPVRNAFPLKISRQIFPGGNSRSIPEDREAEPAKPRENVMPGGIAP